MSEFGFEIIGYIFEGTSWVLWLLAGLIFHLSVLSSKGELGSHIVGLATFNSKQDFSYSDFIILIPINILRFFALILMIIGLSLSLGIALLLIVSLLSLFFKFDYTTIGFLKITLLLGITVAMNLIAKNVIK